MLVIGVVGNDEAGHALQVDSISRPEDIHKLSLDSLKSFPSKVVDSLTSILKHLYHDRQDANN
jgi:hypothetical protein